ncbi:unnamed protein product [Caenorhabditis brenneri]
METIKLLRFPYLVQNAIADNMDLHEIFALSTISQRSERIAKQCLSRQQVYMRYAVDNYLLIQRVYPYQYWKLLNQDSVTVKVFNSEKSKQTTLQTYWENKEDSAGKILQYVLELFPRHSFDLYFEPNHTVEVLQTNMKLMENVNSLNSVGVTNSASNPSEFPPNDELCEAVLAITRRPRVLYLDMTTTDGYLYDPPANVSFNYDIVS